MFLRTQSTYMPKQHVNHINTMLNRFSKCKQVTESSNAHLLLLSCVSKIMERIIFKHVYNYFHRNMVYFINIKQGFCLVILLYTNCQKHITVLFNTQMKVNYVVWFFFAISQRLLIEYGTKVSFLNYKLMVYLVICFTGFLVIQVIGHKK